MNITEKIKYHFDNKKYCKIIRKVGENAVEKSNGYIVDFSENFILLQEIDDFEVDGYSIFPIQAISKIIYNNNDKYYDKIIKLEGIINNVENKHNINLTSWQTIFKTIKNLGFNVIVENEDPDDETFDIGPITKITKSSVYVRYFNTRGILDKTATRINLELITIVKFDNRYTNTFSKYLREQKEKK